MGARGEFFAIGKPQFQKACALGLNPAVALIVLARGTGRDNATTTWSAEAISQHSGITWRRGKEAIDALEKAGILAIEKAGARPIRKIDRPADDADLIWLPNSLVTGAASEVPPIARLRQAQDEDALRLLVELYHDQELAGDGGLPRDVVNMKFARERIAGYGQFEIFGFKRGKSMAYSKGALERYWSGKKKGEDIGVWPPLTKLLQMGLLEVVDYLAESESPQSELIHALSGDAHAIAAANAATELAASLPGGFSYEVENYDYTLPVIKHMDKAAMVGVYRLRYRPKTARTAAWLAQHIEACRQAAERYQQLTAGNFNLAATGT